MSSYNRDTEVQLKGTFRDEIADALADPTEVTLQVKKPDGTETSYLLSNAEVTRESLGVFTRLQVLDATGVWYYRYKGEGTVKTAGWKRIDVTDDPL